MPAATSTPTTAAVPPVLAPEARLNEAQVGWAEGSAGYAEQNRPAAWLERAILAALTAGAGLRLIQYAANRSLWLDEAIMAPAILNSSWSQLLNPRTWGPVPPGFLVLEKLAVTVFGSSEYALRLVPLLAGLVSLFLFLAVARRCLTPAGVVFAVALFAISPYLIYYSSEIKPYSLDVAVALGLVFGALALHPLRLTPLRALGWAVGGVAAAAMSLPSVFVLGGATLALLWGYAKQRDHRSVGALLGVCLAWVVAFGLPYLWFARGVAASPYAQAFWRTGFMPFPPRSLEDLAWFPHTLLRTFEEPLGVLDANGQGLSTPQAVAAILVFFAGHAWMVAHRKFTFLLLAAPILFTLLASGLKRYPFGGDWSTGGRVLLFLAPLFFLAIGEGAAWIGVRLSGARRAVGAALVAVLLLPLAAQAAIAFPFGRAELKPILAYVRDHRQPGDLVYVHYETRQAFEYYAPRFGLRAGDYVINECARFQPHRYLESLTAFRGTPRLWVVFGGGKGAYGYKEKELMLDYLDHIGKRRDDRVALGASTFLYDLRGEHATNAPYQVQLPVLPYAIEEDCGLWS